MSNHNRPAIKLPAGVDPFGVMRTNLGAVSLARLPIPDDAWEFVRDCCSTQDEHAKAKGLADYVRPLVGEGDEYLEVIVRRSQTEKLLRIEKSRQLRVTWLLCALSLHRCLTQRGSRIGYQAKKFDDADLYLRDRMWFIYEHIPVRYDKPKARYVSGAIEVFHDTRSNSPTAQIQALAEGAEQVRQFTFTLWWADEFGFQKGQDESLMAAKPSIDGGGQGIITSSAAGDQNAFYRIGHVEQGGGDGIGTRTTVCQGVEEWKRNGWTTLKIHYTADPHKRGDWASKARQGYTAQGWAQEQEVDFTITVGSPVFDCTGLVETGQNIHPHLPIISGFDYSYLANVCLSGQIVKNAAGVSSLHITSEVLTQATYIHDFAEKVNQCRAALYPTFKFMDYGDYSANQHTSMGTIKEELLKEGITLTTVVTGSGGVVKGINLIQRLMDNGLLEIDPSCISLIRVLRTSYVWSGKVDTTGMPIPSSDHPFADFADALRYLVVNTFDLHNLQGGGTSVVVKEQFRGGGKMVQATEKKPWLASYDQTDISEDGEMMRVDGWRGSATMRKIK